MLLMAVMTLTQLCSGISKSWWCDSKAEANSFEKKKRVIICTVKHPLVTVYSLVAKKSYSFLWMTYSKIGKKRIHTSTVSQHHG